MVSASARINKNGPAWRKLQELRRAAQNRKVLVGVFGDARSDDGQVRLTDLMRWHEFGTKNLPARAPLRITKAEKQREWIKRTARFAKHRKKTVKGTKRLVDDMLLFMGEIASKDVQARITAGRLLALKAATIKRKRKTRPANAEIPLVLTGRLLQAITFRLARYGR